MKIKSAKQKGKRAVSEVREKLLELAPHLSSQDIIQPRGSRKGADLIFSEKAQRQYPFSIEVKNQERLNIWEAIAQAESNTQGDSQFPLVVFKKNRSRLYVALPWEDLLAILIPEFG